MTVFTVGGAYRADNTPRSESSAGAGATVQLTTGTRVTEGIEIDGKEHQKKTVDSPLPSRHEKLVGAVMFL